MKKLSETVKKRSDKMTFDYNFIIKYSNINFCKFKQLFDSKDDMAQTIMLYLLENKEKITSNYNPDKSKFSTFLYNIIENHLQTIASSKQQKNKLKNYVELEKIEHKFSMDNDLSNDLYIKDIFKLIEPLLIKETKLYYYGFTMQEIADKFNISKQAISKKIQNNLDKIRKKLYNNNMHNV